MSDESIEVRFVCPQCGQQLVGPSGQPHAQLHEVLSCPVHGAVGQFQELVKEAGEGVARHLGDQLKQIFKNAGFDVTKESE